MDFSEILASIQRIFVVDFMRYFIAASTAYLIFWVFFIKRLQHRIIQKKRPKVSQMWMEFRYSVSTAFIFAIVGTGILVLTKAGYTKIYTDIAEYGWSWMVISFVLMLFFHDTYFYWAHRFMHHPKVFKHVHLVHHRSTNPSPWAAYSFHPLEAVIETAVFQIIVFSIPAHPLTLFAFLTYMISRNVIGHLGIEIFPSWFLKSKWFNWITVTTHHDLHHKNFNTNYGLYFSWWDKIMGTEDKAYETTFDEIHSRTPIVKQQLKTAPENVLK